MLLVWDGKGLANEPLRARAEGHRKSILCLAWSDDSRRICTGSEDKTLRIWDVPDAVYKASEATIDLAVACRLRGHTEAVVSCAFSAHASTSEEMRVCSGSMDKSVLVWDVGTGSELCRIAFEDCLLGCAFSKCSGFVGAVCLDNSVHVWDVSVEAEPELVDQYLPTTSVRLSFFLPKACAFMYVRIWLRPDEPSMEGMRAIYRETETETVAPNVLICRGLHAL
jgi:WD40 repeat protein